MRVLRVEKKRQLWRTRGHRCYSLYESVNFTLRFRVRLLFLGVFVSQVQFYNIFFSPRAHRALEPSKLWRWRTLCDCRGWRDSSARLSLFHQNKTLHLKLHLPRQIRWILLPYIVENCAEKSCCLCRLHQDARKRCGCCVYVWMSVCSDLVNLVTGSMTARGRQRAAVVEWAREPMKRGSVIKLCPPVTSGWPVPVVVRWIGAESPLNCCVRVDGHRCGLLSRDGVDVWS